MSGDGANEQPPRREVQAFLRNLVFTAWPRPPISHPGIAARPPQDRPPLFNNDVRSSRQQLRPSAPSFLFFFSQHTSGHADRTAGLLIITVSRCPLLPYPLTFPSEENSRWTAAAPSQMPFLLLLLFLVFYFVGQPECKSLGRTLVCQIARWF